MVLMSFQRLVGAACPLSSMLICLLRFCLVLFNGVSAAFLGLLFELQVAPPCLHLFCHWSLVLLRPELLFLCSFFYPYIRAQILSIIESLCEYDPGQEAASQQAESQQGG